MPRPSAEKYNSEEIIETAVELQEAEEARLAALRDREATREALSEVGAAEQLEKAEAEVRARKEQEAKRLATRKRVVRIGAAVSAAVALAVGAFLWLRPKPLEPVTLRPDPGPVALQVSQGSVAKLTPETVGGKQALTLEVVTVTPRNDPKQTWFINLDRHNPPPLVGYQTFSVDLQGTLPHVRVYLEAGTDQRWRSPSLAVPQQWATQTVPLAKFEHQRKEAGNWKTVGWQEPTKITTVSIKAGQFINPKEATGVVNIGEMTFR